MVPRRAHVHVCFGFDVGQQGALRALHFFNHCLCNQFTIFFWALNDEFVVNHVHQKGIGVMVPKPFVQSRHRQFSDFSACSLDRHVFRNAAELTVVGV